MKKLKCSDVLAMVDSLRPNTYSATLKRSWLNTAEVKVKEFTSLYQNTMLDDSFLDEENPSLELGEDKVNIYVYYILAMIDISNQDVAMYNNDTIIFTNLFEEFKKEYRRKHKPEKNTKITSGEGG